MSGYCTRRQLVPGDQRKGIETLCSPRQLAGSIVSIPKAYTS
jgi:hypothetical protein